MRASSFSGEQVAQVDNADPFAAPLALPVHRTPEWIIWLSSSSGCWAGDLVPGPSPAGRLSSPSSVVLGGTGWPAAVVLVLRAAVALMVRRWRWPGWFARLVAGRCGAGGGGWPTGAAGRPS